MSTDKHLDGKVALITGASRGIGAAIARGLAANGIHVILIARTIGALEEIDDEITISGGSSTLVPLDLLDFPAIERLGATIFERWGKLDILISNLIKRNVDPKVIKLKSSESASGNTIRQNYDLLEGIDQEVGKKITKLIKESKLKVQAKIQGNELRISGAKKDNLQEAISKIKELKLELPLQYINFRD